MKSQVFTIYDIKASEHGQPFFSQNAATASRAVSTEVNNPQSTTTFARFPDDFLLYQIGEFDSETGLLKPHDSNIIISKVSDLVSKPPQAN